MNFLYIFFNRKNPINLLIFHWLMLQLSVQHLFPAFWASLFYCWLWIPVWYKGLKSCMFFFLEHQSETGWYLKSNLRTNQSTHLQETPSKRKEIEPVCSHALYLKSKRKLKPHPLNNPFCDLIILLTKLARISQLRKTFIPKILPLWGKKSKEKQEVESNNWILLLLKIALKI